MMMMMMIIIIMNTGYTVHEKEGEKIEKLGNYGGPDRILRKVLKS